MLDDDLVTVDIDWDRPHTRAVQWALQYAYDLVTKIEETTQSFLAAEVARWIESGETVNQLRDRLLASRFFNDATRAQLIAETETTRAFAEGTIAGMRETGVIQRKRWNTANDEIVCPICGPLHNKVVDLDDEFAPGVDLPPAHPRCRCWVTGVVEDVGQAPREVGIPDPFIPKRPYDPSRGLDDQ